MQLIAPPPSPAGVPQQLQNLNRCVVMGVVNVTPDSFSDGGRWTDPASAADHGLALAGAGADIIDVGGESTRPGAQRVDADEEQRRVLPVVRALVDAGVPVSIDTMRATTAAAAVTAGACLVNDVSGGLADKDMLAVMSGNSAAYVVMHWRAPSQVMQQHSHYSCDVAGDVIAELESRSAAAEAAGVHSSRLVLDPGLGFAKESDHNWGVLAQFSRLQSSGYPVLVGASRKRFLGALLSDRGQPRGVGQRDAATQSVSALVAAAGAWGVRVHEVRGTADAVRVVAAWQQAQVSQGGGSQDER